MGLSLKKGQGVSLKKTEHDLSKVTIGLGWDINPVKNGLLAGLFGKTAPDYDLDVAAFLCEADGKVHNLGRDSNGKATLIDSDVIFFNNLCHHSGCLWLTGDNRTGSGDGDDEQIIVKLNDLPAQYSKVVFVVQIYQGIKNNQSFAGVNNAFIRAVDARKQEMVRFNLSGGAYNDTCRSLLFAELMRESSGWAFNAIGTASTSDNFVDWLKQYV
ncbi:TerD family protein [Chromatium okenii]|jgi:stress response protein SCP2|uniref:TerD family protein n=1 Tax=Chromatium okenii TaxID=61644 RepID=UPI0026F0A1CC|nr:TerD family protein [Chromatium okenii]MBV5311230.1 TerD family protein [Chromatium okenii]